MSNVLLHNLSLHICSGIGHVENLIPEKYVHGYLSFLSKVKSPFHINIVHCVWCVCLCVVCECVWCVCGVCVGAVCLVCVCGVCVRVCVCGVCGVWCVSVCGVYVVCVCVWVCGWGGGVGGLGVCT